MRKKTVIIHWSYPIKLENVFSKEAISHIGIYCIYRRFGNNTTLLYIGKTSYSFKSRLFCREQTWLKYLRGQIFVRFGEIISPTAIDDTLIEDIESALIYCKDPIYNDKKNAAIHIVQIIMSLSKTKVSEVLYLMKLMQKSKHIYVLIIKCL